MALLRRRRPAAQVRLLPLGRAGLQALLAGDLGGASARARVELPASFLEPKALWKRTLAGIEADRGQEPWAPRAIVTDPGRVAVGNAGFHGAPDAEGTVEIGFAVDPPHRRRGYARAAVEALVRFAAADGEVRVVRARAAVENAGSLAVLRAASFVAVGEQFDEEDGRLVVLERRL